MRANNLGPTVPKDTRTRLIEAGTKLIAEKGLAGASVRDICAEAEAGRNMIHHYFGSKDGLYQAILENFSSSGFAPALRCIADPAQSAEAFHTKMTLFLTEVLETLVTHSRVFRIMQREQSEYLSLKEFRSALLLFLSDSQERGYIRASISVGMIPGMILDRLGNQVLYALMLNENDAENIILNLEYRRAWLKANADLLVNGFAAQN